MTRVQKAGDADADADGNAGMMTDSLPVPVGFNFRIGFPFPVRFSFGGTYHASPRRPPSVTGDASVVERSRLLNVRFSAVRCGEVVWFPRPAHRVWADSGFGTSRVSTKGGKRTWRSGQSRARYFRIHTWMRPKPY